MHGEKRLCLCSTGAGSQTEGSTRTSVGWQALRAFGAGSFSQASPTRHLEHHGANRSSRGEQQHASLRSEKTSSFFKPPETAPIFIVWVGSRFTAKSAQKVGPSKTARTLIYGGAYLREIDSKDSQR